jgi:outer membrane protein assembly factor BamB
MQADRFERPFPFRELSTRALPASVLAIALAGFASAQWPQWGGPDRNFHSSATGLAEKWPEAGPRRVWERDLGPGYSSIVVDGGRLFTMVQSLDGEVVVALDAETGATLWEHRYLTPTSQPPNATPTLAGGRVYTFGYSGMLSALEQDTGKLVWSHDLAQEYEVKRPEFGFASSPLVHGESLILPVGGAGHGVMAFALADGKLLWHQHDLEEIYASPLRIDVEGEAQVVVLAAGQLIGLDPKTGAGLWREPLEGDQNIATPVWCSDKLLCVTAGSGGSFGLRFSKADGKTQVQRVWKSDVQIAQTTVVRAGDHLYGSTGQDPFYVTAIHAGTGEIVWKEPGFSVANLVAADGKILILDAEGALGLATASPEAWKVSSRVTALQPQSFTAPTVAGKTLYLRDLKKIVALDLGEAK